MLCGVTLLSSAINSGSGTLPCGKKARKRGQTFLWVQVSTAASEGTSRGLPLAGEAVCESVQGNLLMTTCRRFDLYVWQGSIIEATGKVLPEQLFLCVCSTTQWENPHGVCLPTA